MSSSSRRSRLGTDHLLLASLAEEATGNWKAWLRDNRLDDIDAAGFELLPLVYLNLTADGYDGPEMGRLRGIYRQAWYRGQLLINRTAQLFELIGSREQAVVAFGDIALGRWTSADPGDRSGNRADLLVPEESAIAVLDAALSLGWELTNGDYPDLNRHRSKGLISAEGLSIAVHWYFADRHAFGGADDEVWPTPRGGWDACPAVKTMSPTDQLLSTVISRVDPSGRLSLRWVPDALSLIAPPRVSIDWRRLTDVAGGLGLGLTVRDGLAQLGGFAPEAVPATVMAELGEVARFDRIEDWFVRRSSGSYPWRSVPLSWSRYRYVTANAGRRPGFMGFARHLAAQRTNSSVRNPDPPAVRDVEAEGRS